ncbi:GNAT family N-acetyltransferase [Aeromicrobium sp. 636]|uniref:GNAT family N-acetyltransferase n=1 Tax=Aeromicrobium senzhongii TaxID=2663859 RepID=A0A8I0K1H6_9ACTN|nr:MULTISPECIES: GNAT family N-acetyltransferase [Aeromicrobium]MBC9227541.1 GNAT family N-acetyltransferase [Aeromicrobium senzhongii]MCQ3999638.1 GNAT family N-acetyltransferase [Aeromicrobium sp. 636]MTB88043.1 GNAT family N-acetyltransferase [Aeromicrobium senzhongii]QNL94954.1 GNAT family N-acetyltransferase [Aeromicrobium senzhongii]
MSARIVEVDFLDPRAVALRARMSQEMSDLYGRPRHTVGAEDIDPDAVIACLLVLDGDEPVGTVSLRRLRDLVEIKRMFLLPSTRGTGLAPRLLAEIEARAARVTDRVVLHTGERQRAAIALYERSGYAPIEVYPPYDQVPESLCFAKTLAAQQPA